MAEPRRDQLLGDQQHAGAERRRRQGRPLAPAAGRQHRPGADAGRAARGRGAAGGGRPGAGRGAGGRPAPARGQGEPRDDCTRTWARSGRASRSRRSGRRATWTWAGPSDRSPHPPRAQCIAPLTGAGESGEELGPWRRLSTRPIYENPWIEVREDQVIRPDGNPGIYGVVEFQNWAIGVVPLAENGDTFLVGQYRYTLGHLLLGDPGGRRRQDRDAAGGGPARASRGGRHHGRALDLSRRGAPLELGDGRGRLRLPGRGADASARPSRTAPRISACGACRSRRRCRWRSPARSRMRWR